MHEIISIGNDPCCLLDYPEDKPGSHTYKAAYDALPEAYKNDHALNFFIDSNNNLCAEHNLHNEEYLWTGENWVRIK
jgi:hypothetical protein